MNLIDFVLIAIVVAILGGAAVYLRSARKKGKKCIGCPHSGKCGGCHCCK